MTTESMRAATILRIASALAALQYGAHASLFLLAASTHGPGKMAEIAATRLHSYWDFYFGYGLLAILSGLIEVVLLWQLASLAKTNPERIRPMTALFVLANGAHAFLVWKYFSLLVPVGFDVLIAILLGYAFAIARRPDAQSNAQSQVEHSLYSQSKT